MLIIFNCLKIRCLLDSIFNIKPVSVAVVPNSLHYGTLNTVFISTHLSWGLHCINVNVQWNIIVKFQCLFWWVAFGFLLNCYVWLCRPLGVWTLGSNSVLVLLWETDSILRTGVTLPWLQTPANKLKLPQMLTPMIKTKYALVLPCLLWNG